MDRRLRILWLIKGLGVGGAERLLATAAKAGDHEQFIYEAAYVVPEKDTLVEELSSQGVRVHCLSSVSSGSPWPLALRQLLLSNRFDVIHLHSPLVAGVARMVVRTLPRMRRPVVLSTEHNTWESYALPTRLLNASLHLTDQRRWAVSERVRDSVWAPLRQDVSVLVHGISLDELPKDPDRLGIRSELGIASGDVVAVTVANFRPEKAYPDLLSAAGTALREVPYLRLLIVGQGPLEANIRQLHADLGLGDGCQILGYRKDVLRVLGASDFFVLASRHEGFPIAMMEAMASGLPVVATRVGGIPEAVSEGREGLLCSPGDTTALAAAMIEMASNHSRRSLMSDAARRRGRSFDARRAVRTVEAAYRTATTG